MLRMQVPKKIQGGLQEGIPAKAFVGGNMANSQNFNQRFANFGINIGENLKHVGVTVKENSLLIITSIFIIIVAAVMGGSVWQIKNVDALLTNETRTAVVNAKNASMGLLIMCALLILGMIIGDKKQNENVQMFINLSLFVILILSMIVAYSLTFIAKLDDVPPEYRTYMMNAKNSSYIMSVLTILAVGFVLGTSRMQPSGPLGPVGASTFYYV
jgi:hypothetical protein